MSKVTLASGEVITNHGWRNVFAGMGINLALGILYTWSVISDGIPAEWNWNQSDKSWPYSVACLVFCLIMVPAGRMQDKLSPRLVASIGGILVGIGFIFASFMTSLFGFILAFGVIAGAGIGFGYASATPPAVKWFPPAKTGMIAGIVVSGFGLASVYAAPLAKWLMAEYSFKTMLMVLGIGFLVVVVGLAQLLKPPHKVLQFIKGYGDMGRTKQDIDAGLPLIKENDFTPKQMLATTQFYLIWFMYACGAGAGLMIISKLATIADVQAAIKLGFILVAVLAVGNGGGRILAGILSDKIGRKTTMFICFVSQAILIFLLSMVTSESVIGYKLTETNADTFRIVTMTVMAVLSMFIGANYGSNLALFPSITKDFYGLKNFGMNYGLVFTSWGVGGFMLAILAGKMYVKTQSFNFAYFTASALLIVAAITVWLLKPPHHHTIKEN
ncbi:MAG: OFA family MFS transporter [Planctomycetes bacterium]|nr:OFA family MFS transporter [Planctomycetota bacterium]